MHRAPEASATWRAAPRRVARGSPGKARCRTERVSSPTARLLDRGGRSIPPRRATRWLTCRRSLYPADSTGHRGGVRLPRQARRVPDGRGARIASAVDAVRDATENVLDLARADLGIQVTERDGVAEGPVWPLQPSRGLVLSAQSFVGKRHDTCHAEQPIRLVGAKPPLLPPARQGPLGDLK